MSLRLAQLRADGGWRAPSPLEGIRLYSPVCRQVRSDRTASAVLVSARIKGISKSVPLGPERAWAHPVVDAATMWQSRSAVASAPSANRPEFERPCRRTGRWRAALASCQPAWPRWCVSSPQSTARPPDRLRAPSLGAHHCPELTVEVLQHPGAAPGEALNLHARAPPARGAIGPLDRAVGAARRVNGKIV